MASSPWQKMRNPTEDTVPGERGVFAVLLEPPIVEGARHFAHLSWQGESYVLRDYLHGVLRKQGEDLSLASLWRSARERIPCKGGCGGVSRITRSGKRSSGDSRTNPGPALVPQPVWPRPWGIRRDPKARGRSAWLGEGSRLPREFFDPLPEDLLDEFQGEKS